jgi:hypothetical protein
MIFMNYLVFLDTHAGELEKILSGVKCMLVKEIKPSQSSLCPVSQGDSLYFLRDQDDRALRVKATVVRVFSLINGLDEELPRTLKEMQSRLQLTEDQYNHWSAKQQVLLVEFDCAQKISVIQVEANIVTDRADWIPFEEFSQIP